MTKHNQSSIPLEASRRMQLAKSAGVSLALFLAACGGGEAITTSSAEAAPQPAASQAAESQAADTAQPDTAQPDTAVAGASTEAEPAAQTGASVSPEDAAAAAAENIGLLTSAADSVFDIEVLSVSSGQITTLNDVVDGDRPVLLWFWSPH